MAINSINNYVSAASTVATDSKVSSKEMIRIFEE